MDRASFETNFSLLYSVYSIPNVILPFFGGILVDKLGTRCTLIGFNVVLTLASILVAFGVVWKSMWVLIAGRVLYGMAGESLTVVQSAILTQWFKGKELALTFGISLAFSRGGSVLNNYMSPWFAKNISLPASFFFGSLLLFSGIVVSVLFACVDIQTEKKLDAMKTESLLNDAGGLKNQDTSQTKTKVEEAPAGLCGVLITEVSSVKYFPKIFWLVCFSAIFNYAVVMPWNNTAQQLLLQRDLFTTAPELSECCCWAPGHCYESWPSSSGGIHTLSKNESLSCSAGCDFNIKNRQLPLNLTVDQMEHIDCGKPGPTYGLEKYNSPEIPKDNVYLKDYCDSKIESELEAGIWMSIPYYINVASSPFLGFLVDRYGQCATICMLAPAIFTVVHILLGLTAINPLSLLVGQGVAYSVFAAAVWPPVVYIVEEKYIGAAYGVITAGMNTGFSIIPLVAAWIYQMNGNSYLPSVELFYAGLAGLGTLVGIALLIEDGRVGSPYNRVHSEDEA